MNLQGRDFLKLLDYTPEEITYLIDLAAELKEKKKNGIPHDELRVRAVPLRSQHMTSVCRLHILIRPVHRSERKRALRTQPEC